MFLTFLTVWWRVALVTAGIAWAVILLPVDVIWRWHEPTRVALADGQLIKRPARDHLIAAYSNVANYNVCFPGYREQLAAFLVHRAAGYRRLAETDQAIEDLRRAKKWLAAMLSCSPLESNQWLSFAITEGLLNGWGRRSFEALRLSFLTDSRALWVVRRRLAVGKAIAPLLNAELRGHFRGDVHVIEKLDVGQQKAELKQLKIESINSLKELFQ